MRQRRGGSRLGRAGGHRLGLTRRQPARVRTRSPTVATARPSAYRARAAAPPQAMSPMSTPAARQTCDGDAEAGSTRCRAQWPQRRLRLRVTARCRESRWRRETSQSRPAASRPCHPDRTARSAACLELIAPRASTRRQRNGISHAPASVATHDGITELLGVRSDRIQLPDRATTPTGRCRDRTLEA